MFFKMGWLNTAKEFENRDKKHNKKQKNSKVITDI